MNEDDLGLLLNDLVALQQAPEFGKRWALVLAAPDVYDQLVFQVRGSDGQVAKVLTVWHDYPGRRIPTLSARNPEDAFSVRVAELATKSVREQLDPVTLAHAAAAVRQAADRAGDLIERPLQSVTFAADIIGRILTDYQQYAPNEYAFLCSGRLLDDGEVTVDSYYPGQMAISTPVYCELTPAFIEKTVYDAIPADHDIVVWGHVHPIETPSGTDISSFNELAVWDRQLQTAGGLRKRSLALLVSSMSQTPSFFDVHSLTQLPHVLSGDVLSVEQPNQ